MTAGSGDPTPVVSAALARTTGRAAADCTATDLRLVEDLGIDSLALMLLVRSLETELGITVPDEVTGQLHTVGQLQDATRTTHTHPTGATASPPGPTTPETTT